MLGMNVLNIVGNYVLIFGCLGFHSLSLSEKRKRRQLLITEKKTVHSEPLKK